MVPAELVMPWSETSLSNGLFWYSGDEKAMDLTDMDYFIDEVNETVHSTIKHFSKFHYDRR